MDEWMRSDVTDYGIMWETKKEKKKMKQKWNGNGTLEYIDMNMES